MNVCLIVVSIIGIFCHQDAQPVGKCWQHPFIDTHICVIEAEQLPLRASWYDPVLGGVNCMAPCDQLGDGTAVADAYGWVVACPPGWYGRWLDVEYAGRQQCRDHGGAVVPTYGRAYTPEGFVYTWWITVDFLAHEPPPYAYLLLDWRMSDDVIDRDSGAVGELRVRVRGREPGKRYSVAGVEKAGPVGIRPTLTAGSFAP